jgi:hypothetical protein
VGDLVPTIEALAVNVDRGLTIYGTDYHDQWAVDIATGAVKLNAGVPVTATAAQIQELVGVVASSAYWSNVPCARTSVVEPAGRDPPWIWPSGGGADHKFGVSNGTCASSNYSYVGQVLSCSEFAAIYALLEAIAPSGDAFNCDFYW